MLRGVKEYKFSACGLTTAFLDGLDHLFLSIHIFSLIMEEFLQCRALGL